MDQESLLLERFPIQDVVDLGREQNVPAKLGDLIQQELVLSEDIEPKGIEKAVLDGPLTRYSPKALAEPEDIGISEPYETFNFKTFNLDEHIESRVLIIGPPDNRIYCLVATDVRQTKLTIDNVVAGFAVSNGKVDSSSIFVHPRGRGQHGQFRDAYEDEREDVLQEFEKAYSELGSNQAGAPQSEDDYLRVFKANAADGFTKRVANILRHNGVETFSDLATRREREIWTFEGIGKASMVLIRGALKDRGLSLQ